ncbi:hypothetical protein OE88DRAFT_1603193, partial [Heliocybe sulcata]
QEVNMRIVGVLCGKDLPPHLRQPYKKQYLQQYVQLTGFSCLSWKDVISGLNIIHQHMSRMFKDGVMHDWLASEFQEHVALDISSQYFTQKKSVNSSSSIPFNAQVDPKGILTKLIDDGWIHTADNTVGYYQTTETGNEKCIKANPAMFRIGDIVEADVGFIAIPQDGHYRMGLVLRELTLVNSS